MTGFPGQRDLWVIRSFEEQLLIQIVAEFDGGGCHVCVTVGCVFEESIIYLEREIFGDRL